ncbi:MAG: lipoate--protein ligase [Bacteroidia bacterium]|nr:lipoate--protein ligase [Bacteroidia bacterium]
MYHLTLQTSDPYIYLATEEYLLKNSGDEFCILAVNSPSVVIGKHQSPHREVNTVFAEQHNIPVIRRISGGGTVFHDSGNLNFSFIRNCEPGHQVDFRLHTKPVIDFLRSHGADAKFEGKNDIKVNGLKVSGNAEHVHRNRVLHHGTLLFSSDMQMLRSSLRSDTSCYKTRAVNSNPSPVKNLKELIPSIRDVSEFRDKLTGFLKSVSVISHYYHLSADELKEIKSLAASKYMSWEWNYAYGPDYQIIKQFDYQGVSVDCELNVSGGIIRDCSLKGDPVLEKTVLKLNGVSHMPKDLEKVFSMENISDPGIYNFF